MNVTLHGLKNFYEIIIMSLTEFLSMGGYGVYVWSSYGICLIVLILNIIQPVMRERKTIRDLQKRLYSEENKQE
jgi:heme exporter protein D